MIYAPQENRTTDAELNMMYNRIQEQIDTANIKGQKLILLGDFNARIGTIIKGNTEEISKAGKLLIKLMKRNDLHVVYSDQKTKGLWTRTDEHTKSVIDYILINKQDAAYLKTIEIDEHKLITPYRVNNKKVIYTDHSAMTMMIDWREANRKEKKETHIINMSEEKKEMYNQISNTGRLKAIVNGKDELNVKYEKWEKKIIQVANECFQKCKINKYTNKSKRQCKLMKVRRKLKSELKDEIKNESRNKIKERINILTQNIEEEQRRENSYKGIRLADKITKTGGVNNPTFWKVIDAKEKKKETRTAMIDNKGKIKEEVNKVKEIYEEWFKTLLKTPEPENDIQKKQEEEINNTMRLLSRCANITPSKTIENEEIEKAIRKLKRNKAADIQGFRNEYVIYGGEEVKQTLLELLNEILQQQMIPNRSKRSKKKKLTTQ